MINSIIIALLLLGQVRESDQQAWHTANMIQRMAGRCFGAGCQGWVYRPLGGDLFQHVYDLVKPDGAMDLLDTMSVGRRTTQEDIIDTQARDSSRYPPGYREDTWKRPKGRTAFIDPDGVEWTEDKKHQNNPKPHWDVTDPKTGRKIREVGPDGTVIWPNGAKNKNKT